MAKEYWKKNSTRRKGSSSKLLVMMLVSFLTGYLTASIFDLTSVSNWINTQLLAQHTSPIATKSVAQQAPLPKPKFEFYTLLANQHAQSEPVANVAPVRTAATTLSAAPTIPAPSPVPANPANELLAKNQPAPIAVTSAKTLAPIVTPVAPVVSAGKSASLAAIRKKSYLVQVASFKSRVEAERIKGSLVLKGFAVNVVTVNQQQTSWFRVIIGPYESRDQAEKAQVSIARSEHLNGMIRRMDA